MSWLKDGQRYLGNGRISESQTQPDAVQLHIMAVTKEDQGMYQCFVNNDEGDSAQATVQLAIGGGLSCTHNLAVFHLFLSLFAAFPPHLKQTFTRQMLHPGSSVSFKCLATGTPLPHFTWTLDGYPLPVSERSAVPFKVIGRKHFDSLCVVRRRYFLVQQQTGVEDQVVTYLNISHVRVEDGGNYKVGPSLLFHVNGQSKNLTLQCTAENRVGKVDHIAPLHVFGPPYVRPMGNVAAVGGKRLELPCPVAGWPIEAIVWEKGATRSSFCLFFFSIFLPVLRWTPVAAQRPAAGAVQREPHDRSGRQERGRRNVHLRGSGSVEQFCPSAGPAQHHR